MRLTPLRAAAVVAALAIASVPFGFAAPAPDSVLFPIGHDFEGLPVGGQTLPVYAADATAPLNRLHALLFLSQRTPTEIGATLPAERRRLGQSDGEFFNGKWAFAGRKAKEIDATADTRWFGGDVRTSPVEKLSPADAAAVRELLAPLATPAAAAVAVKSPLARLSLQWDLLQLWWRFEQKGGADDATLLALARAIRSLGQSRDTLQVLPSGLASLAAQASPTNRDRRQPRAPLGLLDGPASPWVEVDRESAALFRATRSLCSARVFVKCGDRAAAEALVARAAALAASGQLVEIPRDTEVALLLSMVGLTAELDPVATPVVSELRLRMAVAEPVLIPTSDTSTRDGWNHWGWTFSRAAHFAAPSTAVMRFVPDSTQALFLEYGSPKYTTAFAQCSLCHRATNAGGQNPSGVHVLGRYAKPRVLLDPAKRLQDAEREMAPVVKKLRERLAAAEPAR